MNPAKRHEIFSRLRAANPHPTTELEYSTPFELLVAVVLFHEPLDPVKLASFALCWLGITVYTADSILTRHPQPVADEPE